MAKGTGRDIVSIDLAQENELMVGLSLQIISINIYIKVFVVDASSISAFLGHQRPDKGRNVSWLGWGHPDPDFESPVRYGRYHCQF